MMDLSAHAPSLVLVPSVPQEEAPLETSHRTPRGRPKKGRSPAWTDNCDFTHGIYSVAMTSWEVCTET